MGCICAVKFLAAAIWLVIFSDIFLHKAELYEEADLGRTQDILDMHYSFKFLLDKVWVLLVKMCVDSTPPISNTIQQ